MSSSIGRKKNSFANNNSNGSKSDTNNMKDNAFNPVNTSSENDGGAFYQQDLCKVK